MALKKRNEKNILWFKDISIKDVALVGGKNASLGEMYSKLTKQGVSIPNGFAITASAYWSFLRSAGLDKKIKVAVKDLDVTDVRALARTGKKIREMILKAKFPKSIENEIISDYKKLSDNKKYISVAVRSSATAEDLPEASFAGQQETYLNVHGEKEILKAVKKCIASLFTNRAMSYRHGQGFDHLNVALSVTIQEMVKSDTGTSGVLFTLDTESGFGGVVLINASYGLGEYVVKGRVTPDQFYIFKDGVKRGKKAIISRILGSKEVKLVYGSKSGTVQVGVKKSDQNKFSVSDDDIIKLTKWGMLIEEHYKKPQDIEWAKDGETGKLYIVQARPETVKARSSHAVIEDYRLKRKSKVLLEGISIGQKIGAGKVRVIEKPAQMKQFKKGEVLVTRITDPDWEPIMRIASAIVTEQGGKTSHAAIVSRELGVPAIVGARSARKILKTGKPVTVSCAEGDEGKVYTGILPFEVKKTEIKKITKTKTKIMMNVGDPDHAFALSFLPNDGVGLAREEFIFSNFIRIHPLALLNYGKLKDKKAKKKIAEMTRGYKKKSDYCVDKLAEGIARIAAASYKNDVIVRLSDFKTNEYATLIGGAEFEPKEQNPMLGWRGASRYYSKEYKEAFKLECAAIKKVREDWGLTNVIPMVPFCRTPEEGIKVIDTMAKFGLKQGENGLQVYVMCEIPSNVILAEEFAKIFDGFSIGSNDLTQLALGVDRDSALVSHVYDEKNKAVTTLIRDVIRVAHKHKRKIGICGQAPSDYPEFAEFLVREGIDSISLNPDTVVSTRERIAYAEKTIGRTGKKTNKKFLGLVGLIGILGAGLIGLGAGCADITGQGEVLEIEAASPSLAELREKLTERVREDKKLALASKDEEFAARTALLRDEEFDLQLEYPSQWDVEYWNGGITISDPETENYFSLFRQIIGHPVPDANKLAIEIDGLSGIRYEDSSAKDGSLIYIVELDQGKTLELNGNSEHFEKVLESLDFGLKKETSERPLNHWDIRDKRICVQIATYARQNKGAQCELFPTPCDVPEYWEVCDGSD